MESIQKGALTKLRLDSDMLKFYAKKNKTENSCENFEKGECPYGDKCAFRHIPPLLKPSLTSEEKKT